MGLFKLALLFNRFTLSTPPKKKSKQFFIFNRSKTGYEDEYPLPVGSDEQVSRKQTGTARSPIADKSSILNVHGYIFRLVMMKKHESFWGERIVIFIII